MRYRAFFITVLMLITVLLPQAFGQPTGGFSFQINGQVRYAESKAPAPNAIVRVERVSGGMAGQQVTDNSGKFSFMGLAGQMYTVTVHVPGYKEYKQDVDLLTANTGYVSAFLVKDESAVGSSAVQPLPNPPVIDSNVPLNAQKEYADAKTLIDIGDAAKLTKAIIHLEKAIQIYPKYLEAHLARGLVQMDLRDWGKAEISLRSALDISPEAVTAYWALGQVYTRQKKWTDALDTLKKGIALNGRIAEGHFALADAYWEMAPSAKDEAAFKGSLENSWKEVRLALGLDPRHAGAHVLAGNLLLKARKPKEALGHFQEYLRLVPSGVLAEQTRALVQKINQAMAQDRKSN